MRSAKGGLPIARSKPPAELAARVILAADPRLGMHEARDAGGDRVVFDAGQLAGLAQRLRQQREEQAGAHAGLEHAAAGEAETLARRARGRG